MDQEKFKNKILPLGALVKISRRNAIEDGFEDTEFRLHPIKKLCTDCNWVVANRVVTYEVKWSRKEPPYWVKKCLVCKEKTALKDN